MGICQAHADGSTGGEEIENIGKMDWENLSYTEVRVKVEGY